MNLEDVFCPYEGCPDKWEVVKAMWSGFNANGNGVSARRVDGRFRIGEGQCFSGCERMKR